MSKKYRVFLSRDDLKILKMASSHFFCCDGMDSVEEIEKEHEFRDSFDSVVDKIEDSLKKSDINESKRLQKMRDELLAKGTIAF